MKQKTRTLSILLRPGLFARFAWVLTFTAMGAFGSARAQAPDWTVNPSDYESTMSVTAALYFGSDRSTSTDDIVAAFVGEEVRGFVQPILVGGLPVYFLTVYANQDGEALTFKAYDAAADAVRDIAETLAFTSNAVVGTPSSPFAWTAEGALAPPEAPRLLSPSDGATEQPTSLTLRWQEAPTAASYHLHVAEDGAFQDLLVNAAGWAQDSYQLGSLEADATYYWRVRSVNASGESAWSAAFQFTTAPPVEIPAAPTLTAPSDGAADTPTSLALRWQAADGATTYDVQLATEASFATRVVDEQGLVERALEVSGLAQETSYFWRVRSVNASGESAWSEIFSFSTEAADPPARPTLTAPSDGAADTPTSLTLRWQVAGGATTYDVQLATEASFATRVVDEKGLVERALEVSGLAQETSYFWRVRSVNASGESAWSAAFQFTTAPPVEVPAAPTLVAPANESVGHPTTLTVRWSTPYGTDRFVVHVASDAAFTTLVVDRTVQGQDRIRVSGLAEGQTYHWRVRAENAAGASAWSEVFRFTTAVEPEAPVPPRLLLPAHGETDQPPDVALTWQAAPRAASYRVQVAMDAAFSTLLMEVTGIEDLSLQLDGLDAGTTYAWRVQAEGAGGASSWSDVFQFTTREVAPSVPTLVSPGDGAPNQATTLLLQWQAAPHATRYQLKIAAEAGFTEALVDLELSATEILVAHLLPAKEYYWRVRGIGPGGTGPWSEAFQFTTEEGTRTGVDAEGLPATFALAPNYPNPFRSETTIAYSLPRRERVLLTVYNLLGQEVARLVDADQPAGHHQALFHARTLPSGTYVCRLRAGERVATRMLLLAR